jgi:uncharacterized protein
MAQNGLVPLMPHATAAWLVDNTALSFTQIAEFCGLHILEVQAMADDMTGTKYTGRASPPHEGPALYAGIKTVRQARRHRLAVAQSHRNFGRRDLQADRYHPQHHRRDP